MKANAWPQIDELFQTAVELDPERRSAFLDDACRGDHSLQSEIESLLTTDALEWDLLEQPALESAALLLADEEPRLRSGEKVGHYEIVDLIGKGGMGEVYLARDLILNRNIALKLLPLDYTQDRHRLQRFQREARSASSLNHPNILTVHELGEVDGQQYIATELIDGETLRQRLVSGRMSATETLEIAIQIAGALSAAHRASVIHRDIKPDNIMLRPDGYVKVLDFGLAKLAEDSDPDPTTGTDHSVDLSSRMMMGTPRYMSPEQIIGLAVDGRSDIFSLGAVVYEMLAGRPAFSGADQALLAESILTEQPPPLEGNGDVVQEKLAGVVAKMLSKDREDRYKDAGELLDDLSEVRSESGGKATNKRLGGRAIALIFLACAGVIAYVSYQLLSFAPRPLSTNTASAKGGIWTIKAPLDSSRSQAEPVVLNGVLYATGGWNVCTAFADLEAYDASNDRWIRRAPMLTARGAHGIATLDGQLYAVGGSVDCGENIASVEAYDPTSNTWSRKTPLPQARARLVVAASNGKLYSIGGMTHDGKVLDLNSEYDPRTDAWAEKAPLPTPRAGAAVAVLDGIVYVIGGSNGNRSLAIVEAYDPLTDSWMPKQPMLEGRNAFAAAELDGKIYAFGGIGNRRSVEEYDPVANTWSVIAELPENRSSFHAAVFEGSIYLVGGFGAADYLSSVLAFTPRAMSDPKTTECYTAQTSSTASMHTPRGAMAIGAIDGKIYAAGGYDKRSGFLSTNEEYDPIADRWSERAPIPGARETRASGNSVVAGKLYVIGGNAGGYCTGANQAYDPKTDTWSNLAPMPTPRCHVGVVEHNGMLYAIGGTNTNGSIRYTTVEVYDTATDIWTTATPMPTGRHDARAVSINGMIYAVGGWNPELRPDALDVVEAYDPVTGKWSRRSPMPRGRYGMAVGLLNGLLIVAGGYSNEVTLASVEAYDPVHDSWRTLTSMSTPRDFASGVTLNDAFYVFGGNDGPDASGFLATGDAIRLSPCAN